MSNIFHPGIFLILCGILAAVVPEKLRKVLLMGGPLVCLILFFATPIGTTGQIALLDQHPLTYFSLTQNNYMFLFVFVLIALLGGIYAAHTKGKLESFCALGYAGAGISVTLAGDWFTMIVFWEFMAVTSLGLVWCNRTPASTKAGFRYLIMHMLGGNLLLFGILMKIFEGGFVIECLTGQYDLAFWLIFLGIAINAAVVPLHTWLPDAYPESTVTGCIYMSSFTTKVAAFCMLQVFCGERFLIVLGVIMMLYGAIFALMENNLRRVLSYHMISQLGIIVIDIGIGGTLGSNAATVLAFSNIIYKALLFMCAGAIIRATGLNKITQLGGLAKKMPLVCICFFIAALSITGIPPFAGFTAKSLSVAAVQSTGSMLLEILLYLGTIGTALSLLFKMGYFTFFGVKKEYKLKPVPKNMYVAMIAGAGLCILFGVAPNLAYDMLPHPEHYHIYSLHHILEYTQMIPATLLAFVLFLKKMAPHDTITLDLDWFIRIPFKKGFYAFSGLLAGIQNCYDQFGIRLQRKVGLAAANPLNRTPAKSQAVKRKPDVSNRFDEDAYRPQIGGGILAILITSILIGILLIVSQLY